MNARSLVFAESRADVTTPESLFALEKARGLGTPVDVLATPPPSPAVATTLVAAGAEQVFAAAGSELARERSQPYVDAVVGLVGDGKYDTVLFPASALALNVAAGASARLEAGVNWGLVDLRLDGGALIGVQWALEDTFVVECGWSTPVRLAVLRGSATAQGAAVAHPPQATPLDVEPSSWSTALEISEEEVDQDGEAGQIAKAKIIVAGGRGVGGPEGFRLLEEVADALGAAVAATLPVVEAGWYPRRALVGQSGAAVSPRIYIACGISGAVQHKVGARGAETIIAVNTDASAPIFDWCDIGIVGELQTVLPRVLELVRAGPPWPAVP